MKNILSAIAAIFLTTQAMASYEIQWIEQPTPTSYRPAMKADFSREDVLNYAAILPRNYHMNFLNSDEGKSLISEVIDQLNANQMPKENSYIFQFWSRTWPSTTYNMFLVADYVSSFYRLHNISKDIPTDSLFKEVPAYNFI